MALTFQVEQELEKAGLIEFFEDDRDSWLMKAANSHQFLRDNYPSGAQIRPDDLAKALGPVLEVDVALKDFLENGKLKQKYWTERFVDLIVDRWFAENSNP